MKKEHFIINFSIDNHLYEIYQKINEYIGKIIYNPYKYFYYFNSNTLTPSI